MTSAEKHLRAAVVQAGAIRFGDGSTLWVIDNPWGRIGSVTRWENHMPMRRMAMYAKNVAL